MNNRDRDVIQFARTQQNAQAVGVIIMLLILLTLGVLHTLGVTDAQIVAWLVEKGILIYK